MDVESMQVSEDVEVKIEKNEINDKNEIKNEESELNELPNVCVVENPPMEKTTEANECETDANIPVAHVQSINTLETELLSEKSRSETVNDKKISSLSAIALEYDSSESETEEDNIVHSDNCLKEVSNSEVQITHEKSANDYRAGTTETYDSDDDDDDDVDDSSSSEDSSSVITDDSDDTDDSDNETVRDTRVREKRQTRDKETNSELDSLPPIEDLKISMPEVLCDPFGEVAWFVDRLVVVKPKPGKPTLNLDTVLFVDKGQRALGRIYDVFGQVAEPHYCVRFNSTDHIEENHVKIKMTVYYCPNTPYTSLVFLHELTKIKGFDGVGEDEPPEFSDDEEERAYYAALKQKQLNERRKENDDATPHKKKRTAETTWQSNHPWNRNPRPQGGRRNFRNRGNAYPPNQNWNPFHFYHNQYWPPDERQMQLPYGDQYRYPAGQFGATQGGHNHETADPYMYGNESGVTGYPSPASAGITFGSPARLPSRPIPSAAALADAQQSNRLTQHLRFPYDHTSTMPSQHVPSWSMPPPPPPPPIPPPQLPKNT